MSKVYRNACTEAMLPGVEGVVINQEPGEMLTGSHSGVNEKCGDWGENQRPPRAVLERRRLISVNWRCRRSLSALESEASSCTRTSPARDKSAAPARRSTAAMAFIQ